MLSVTDFVPKESFPGSEFKPASIWTCWMLIDCQMQSAFTPELHRWITKLTARHLQLACPPGDLLITTLVYGCTGTGTLVSVRMHGYWYACQCMDSRVLVRLSVYGCTGTGMYALHNCGAKAQCLHFDSAALASVRIFVRCSCQHS